MRSFRYPHFYFSIMQEQELSSWTLPGLSLSFFHLILAGVWAFRAYEYLDQRVGRGNERRQENWTSEVLII